MNSIPLCLSYFRCPVQCIVQGGPNPCPRKNFNCNCNSSPRSETASASKLVVPNLFLITDSFLKITIQAKDPWMLVV